MDANENGYNRSDLAVGSGLECADLDFVYDDTDCHINEIAELYSYTEQPEFTSNLKAFEDQMEEWKMQPYWQKLNELEHNCIVLKLLDQLDESQNIRRMKAARCILYIAQGCWSEVQSDQEQLVWSRKNVFMLYRLGVFSAFVELLNYEIEQSTSTQNAPRKIAVSLADSEDLRIILSVLYIITEVIRAETCKTNDNNKYQADIANFRSELLIQNSDELLPVKLLSMITRFCSNTATHFPMKKVLLLLWKVSLVGLGGMNTLRILKEKYRERAGLQASQEDTLEIAKRLRASSPPTVTADILDNQNPKRNRPFRRVRTNDILQESLIKQSSLDEQEQMGLEMEAASSIATTNGTSVCSMTSQSLSPLSSSLPSNQATDSTTGTCIPPGDNFNQPFQSSSSNSTAGPTILSSSSATSVAAASTVNGNGDGSSEVDISEYYCWNDQQQMANGVQAPGPKGQKYDGQNIFCNGTINKMNGINIVSSASPLPDPIHEICHLPWIPKVRQKDIDQFLDTSRSKFIGFTLPDDQDTLAGLPQPIHEGLRILKRHVYVSLADVQVRREEKIARNPITTSEGEIELTAAEILYQAILPNLPQYMIALLKILLAAAPTSKAKTESINIMADVLPEAMPVTVTQSTKLGIDVNRHKEIIVKAVSAILLLYLKHFKINHVYQFEFMSQHLVFANCIPLVLKFFNQNIMSYVDSKNTIPIMDFPSCVIGEQPELTSDSLVFGDSAPYSWRNIFSCINLLRILNKLTKWKHSRIMMLVVFKSAPILKRTLHVRYAMMQLYVLKLLKMQTKYLGRQWRKSNMKTISAIYAKVRHRLNDDWAFGNDLDARPWDFQAEECTLRTCVDRFNNRRYLALQYPNGIVNAGVANGIAANNLHSSSKNNGGTCTEMIDIDGNLVTSNGQHQQQQQQQQQLLQQQHTSNNGIAFNGIPVNSNFGNSTGFGCWDEDVELTDEFKHNYEMWLHQEVYNMTIDWDALLIN